MSRATFDIKSPQKRLQYYFEEAFPRSIEALDKRKESLSKTIQTLEASYIAAGNNITKQYAAKEEAKIQLVQALAHMASDFEALSSSIDNCVNIEMNSTEALSHDVNLIQQRITIAKEGHLKHRYSQLLGPIASESNIASRIIPENNGNPPVDTRDSV